jgi:hypothetical protein
VGFGHVFREGGMAPPVRTSGMNGNPFILEQDFNDALGDPDFHLFFDQLIRNTVVMAVHINMIPNTGHLV